jgi:hypothetical protein
MFGRRVALGVLFASLACLAWTAGAAAAIRYASPGASGPEPCNPTACNLVDAVDGHSFGDVQPGTQVQLATGPYNPGRDLQMGDTVEVGPAPGVAPPLINGPGGAFNTFYINGAAFLHDVRISQPTGSQPAVRVLSIAGPARVERIAVTSGDVACELESGVLLDSVCSATGAGAALRFDFNGAGSVAPQVRNITAVDTAAGGRGIFIFPGTVTLNMDLVNVIAQGGPGGADLSVDPYSGSSTTVTLRNSLYSAVNVLGGNVTPAGTNSNITAAPQFVNAAAGDFHELGTSPTIDAGLAAPDIGAFDLDKASRATPTCLGGAGVPDIGAYELATAVPPALACGKFTIGKLKLNKKKGTGELHITVPGSGSLKASAKGMKKASSNPTAAGDIKLKLKASGKSKRKLAGKGKLKLKVKLAWTPTGGAVTTQTDKVKLKKK